MQIPPRTETRLVAECKDAVDWHTRSIATWVHLSLLAAKKKWNSAFAGSISDPLTQPSSSRPSSSCPKSWQAEYSSPPMTISVQKQLSPCPTGERAATLERMVLTRSSRKRRLSLRNFFRRKLLFIPSRNDSRRVPSKKNSSAIVPKHEWFHSGACTPPTSEWPANRYSASLFVANSTQIGSAPRTPYSHNRHAQSPMRWNCVQLNQHRQWPKINGNWTLPPNFRADYQMRIKTGVIRKFPSLPRGNEESTRSATIIS